MNNNKQDFGILMRSLDAAVNKSVLLLFAFTAIAAGVCLYLGAKMTMQTFQSWPSLVFGSVAALIALVGFSAGGFMLMDRAKGYSQRSALDAIISAIFSLPKIVGAAILEILVLVGLGVVIALLALVCKVPGIGPFLYTFVLPASVLISGLILFAFVYASAMLLLPAFWDGRGVMEALARVWGVTTRRFMQTFISGMLLSILVGIAAALVATILFTGTGFATMVTAQIIGSDAYGFGISSIGLTQILSILTTGSVSGNEYITAAMYGLGFLYLVAMMVPAAIATYGICNVYLAACDGLDFKEAEQGIGKAVSDMKQKVEEASQRAKDLQAQRANPVRSEGSLVTEPYVPDTSNSLACPKCNETVSAEDVFCGGCGHKLK